MARSRPVGNGIQLINLKVAAGTPVTAGTAGPPSIAGGVTNSGTIISTGTGYAGIALDGAKVSNGIVNAVGGTITATNGAGILLGNTGHDHVRIRGAVRLQRRPGLGLPAASAMPARSPPRPASR